MNSIKEVLYKSSNKKFKRSALLVDKVDVFIQRMENYILTKREKLIRNKASITLLLLLTGARIGNKKSIGQTCNLKYNSNFGKQVDAYGISTLKWKHIILEKPNIIKLNYIGKKQVEQNYVIKNNILYDYLTEINYENLEENVFGDISNLDIRKFINKYVSKKVLIKDLRTIKSNTIFAEQFNKIKNNQKPKNKKEFIKEFNDILLVVAEQLGNTPNVCKKRYCSITLQDSFLKDRSEFLSEKVLKSIKKQFNKIKIEQNKFSKI